MSRSAVAVFLIALQTGIGLCKGYVIGGQEVEVKREEGGQWTNATVCARWNTAEIDTVTMTNDCSPASRPCTKKGDKRYINSPTYDNTWPTIVYQVWDGTDVFSILDIERIQPRGWTGGDKPTCYNGGTRVAPGTPFENPGYVCSVDDIGAHVIFDGVRPDFYDEGKNFPANTGAYATYQPGELWGMTDDAQQPSCPIWTAANATGCNVTTCGTAAGASGTAGTVTCSVPPILCDADGDFWDDDALSWCCGGSFYCSNKADGGDCPPNFMSHKCNTSKLDGTTGSPVWSAVDCDTANGPDPNECPATEDCASLDSKSSTISAASLSFMILAVLAAIAPLLINP